MNLRKAIAGGARFTLQTTHAGVARALTAAKDVVSGTLNWSADRIDDVTQKQLLERVVVGLRSSSAALRQAEAASATGMAEALSASARALRLSIGGVDQVDDYVRKNLLEDVHVGSIVGTSFAGVQLCEIQPAFRSDGEDLSADAMAQRFADSGCRRAIFCVPGLLSDEGLWTNEEGPHSLDTVLADSGFFLIRMRFNPGVHVSDNGRSLLTMIRQFLDHPLAQGLRPDVLTFSMGGLIFRSALYQAQQEGDSVAPRVGKAVLVSSPDGGSYLEKLGFWVGAGVEDTSMAVFNLIGLIGNQRSDAIRDLSHGLIREEDWKQKQRQRYGAVRYFGELDDIDAYQVYSLLHLPSEPWRDWVGDGIVEKASLTLLSDVYRRKSGSSKDRVTVIHGKSHHQVLHAEETCRAIGALLAA